MAQPIDLISRMRDLDGKLPKREQQIAQFVLGNLDQISFLSQREIAEATGVSVATVNRFCTSIGCSGFRDFKIHIAQSVAVSTQYLDESVHIDEGEQTTKVFATLLEALTLVRKQLDANAIEAATRLLANANRIVFLGVGGNSANIAREGANRFFRLGIPSEAHADGYFQRMLVSTLGTGDVVVAISASGTPSELLDSISIANQYGAKTISITKSASPLARNSDISIEINLEEDQDIFKPTALRHAHLAIIDVLATGTAYKRPDMAKENLRRIRTSMLRVSNETNPNPIGD